MRIFIDTAALEEIEQAVSYGFLDGVTTNPSLIKKAVDGLKAHGKVDMAGYIKRILKTARGTPVSLEVIGTTYEEMVREGRLLYRIFNGVAKNVVVKIPINTALDDQSRAFDAIRAIKALSGQKIPVNCTLIFTPEQALLAAKAGATYVSPFAGRIDDHLRTANKLKFGKTDYFPEEGLEKGKVKDDNGIVSGVDLVAQCVAILEEHGLKTQVLAASLRNTRQVRECALAGAHVATLPLGVIKALVDHHKTREGMQAFLKDVVPEYAGLLK